MTIPVTLVAGGTYAAREERIAALLDEPAGPASVILEGLPDGRDAIGERCMGHAAPPRVVRLPPGCPCCAGNLVIRVTLNRLLRPAPGWLFIGIADPSHLPRVREFLAAPPYSELLHLTPDIVLAGA